MQKEKCLRKLSLNCHLVQLRNYFSLKKGKKVIFTSESLLFFDRANIKDRQLSFIVATVVFTAEKHIDIFIILSELFIFTTIP